MHLPTYPCVFRAHVESAIVFRKPFFFLFRNRFELRIKFDLENKKRFTLFTGKNQNRITGVGNIGPRRLGRHFKGRNLKFRIVKKHFSYYFLLIRFLFFVTTRVHLIKICPITFITLKLVNVFREGWQTLSLPRCHRRKVVKICRRG